MGKLAEIADFSGQLFKNEWEENYKFVIQENALYYKYKDYKSGMRIFTSFPVDQNPTPPAYSGEIY